MNIGYERNRFVDLKTENFDCVICSSIARDPKDCSACGSVFCTLCISDWMKKKNECPSRCNKDTSKIDNIQRALKKIYSELKIKCETCDKVCDIYDIDNHEKICKMPKCQHYELCGNGLFMGDDRDLVDSKVCDNSCLLLTKVQSAQTKDQLYQVIKMFVRDRQISQPQLVQTPMQVEGQPQQQKTVGLVFKWDKNRVGTGILLADQDQSLFLREQAYMFRTALAEHGFTQGCHYWEIVADERTENELKIGLCSKRDFNYNTAFCDFEYGWAYYGLGQLRHNSNATGQAFGKRFKKEGVLGLYLNMNKGTLSVALNGELMGVAYNDPKLKQGPLYPAVSLLHCAGCKLVTGKPIPQYFANC